MFVRNVETSWGENAREYLLDKLVLPFAVSDREKVNSLSELLGDDRSALRAPQEENFYRSEDFRIKG